MLKYSELHAYITIFNAHEKGGLPFQASFNYCIPERTEIQNNSETFVTLENPFFDVEKVKFADKHLDKNVIMS